MTPSDTDLVRAFLERRDEGAFRQLVERHAAPVLRTAHRITGDPAAAEDALQETFLAVMRRLSRYDPRRSFRAWTLGIAVKCARKAVRGRVRRRRREEEREMSIPHQPAPEEQAHRREIDALLAAALEELPAPRRAALHLHYREGLTLSEVAQALGVSPGTAKSRIARGLAELRGRLGHGALGSLLLPDLLAHLPGPSLTPALLQACAAKALGAGPVAALPLATKLVAAVLLAGAGTVAAVGLLGGDRGAAPRTSRAEVAAVRAPSADARPPAAAGSAAPAESRSGPDAPLSSGPVDARSVDAPREPGAVQQGGNGSPGAGAESVGGAAGPEGRRARTLPDGAQVVRGAPGAPAGPGEGRRPGRFQPTQRGWTKFAPPPAHRGEATLRGRVLDVDGAPVAGAEVYRMPLDVDRSQGTVVSFEFLTRVATTAGDGTFEGTKQEAGTFFLVANHARQLNRPRGMETRDAVVVQVAEQGTAEQVTLRLPFAVGELVPLRGLVTDADGGPIAGAQVFLDYQELRTDAEGRFEAASVPVGTRQVLVRRTGYVQLEGTVEAASGAENVAHLVLELEEKGELRLAGLLLDQAGKPVAGATVYLNAPGRTIRSVVTGERGHYAFEQLPERLAEERCTLTVWAKGYFPKHVEEVPLPADPFEIRVDRSVHLVVKVVSAANGEPLQQIRGEARRERTIDGKVEFSVFTSWSVFREDGVLDELNVPVGKIQLELEAPGHAVTTLELEIGPDDVRRELEVRLPAAPGDGE